MAKEVETETKTNRMSTMNVSHGWLYGVLGVLIILVVFMAGMGIARHRQVARTGGFLSGPGSAKIGMRQRGFRTGGGFGGGANSNGQSRTSGVVTAVNGSDFTLAGNGSTTNVTTNSSTQYQDGNQVKQNDTVIVFGTTANNTLTATSVIINP